MQKEEKMTKQEREIGGVEMEEEKMGRRGIIRREEGRRVSRE